MKDKQTKLTDSLVASVRTHKAAEFTNAIGESIISFQLLNDDGKAIAIADFRNSKVERFDSTRDNLQVAKDWLQDVTACVNNIYKA